MEWAPFAGAPFVCLFLFVVICSVCLFSLCFCCVLFCLFVLFLCFVCLDKAIIKQRNKGRKKETKKQTTKRANRCLSIGQVQSAALRQKFDTLHGPCVCWLACLCLCSTVCTGVAQALCACGILDCLNGPCLLVVLCLLVCLSVCLPVCLSVCCLPDCMPVLPS